MLEGKDTVTASNVRRTIKQYEIRIYTKKYEYIVLLTLLGVTVSFLRALTPRTELTNAENATGVCKANFQDKLQELY